jgi:hypothetical protein
MIRITMEPALSVTTVTSTEPLSWGRCHGANNMTSSSWKCPFEAIAE